MRHRTAAATTKLLTNPATQFSKRLGELGFCGTVPGSMILNCSLRVPTAASRSVHTPHQLIVSAFS